MIIYLTWKITDILIFQGGHSSNGSTAYWAEGAPEVLRDWHWRGLVCEAHTSISQARLTACSIKELLRRKPSPPPTMINLTSRASSPPALQVDARAGWRLSVSLPIMTLSSLVLPATMTSASLHLLSGPTRRFSQSTDRRGSPTIHGSWFITKS